MFLICVLLFLHFVPRHERRIQLFCVATAKIDTYIQYTYVHVIYHCLPIAYQYFFSGVDLFRYVFNLFGCCTKGILLLQNWIYRQLPSEGSIIFQEPVWRCEVFCLSTHFKKNVENPRMNWKSFPFSP